MTQPTKTTTEMRHNLLRPCPQCPFVPGCLPGWLGGSTPEQYHAEAMSEGGLACHISVDGKADADGIAQAAEVEQCAGALLYAARCGKLYRNQVLRAHLARLIPGLRAFTLREFLEYHHKESEGATP